MRDIEKIQAQFVSEMHKMRQALAELKTLNVEHGQVEKALREIEDCYRALFE